MATTNKADNKILKDAFSSEVVKMFLETLQTSQFVNLSVDPVVHEYLNKSAKDISRERDMEKLNEYLESLGKVDSYLGEQLTVYKTYLELELKPKLSETLGEEKSKGKNETRAIVGNKNIREIKGKIAVVDAYVETIERYVSKIGKRIEILRSIIISRATANKNSNY